MKTRNSGSKCLNMFRHHSMLTLFLSVVVMVSMASPASLYPLPMRREMKDSPGISEIVEKLRTLVDKLVAEDKFSGAVLIAKDGKPVFEQAYGLASKGFNVPNRIDTKFNLGSMGKMFTAVAIAQLAEQGKLSFDDTLGKLAPDCPNKEIAGKVTIHQLLTHTSGLGSYFNAKFMNSSRASYRDLEDYLPLIADEKLAFEPGTKWSYSNTGFLVLGFVIEKVSGQNYFDYVREHIFKPAGMINTDNYDLDTDPPNLALGYTKIGPDGKPGNGSWRTNIFLHVARGASAGGGFSTVPDLLAFDKALRGHKILGPKYTDIIWTGKVETQGGRPKYGYGFEDDRRDGIRSVGHGGGFAGINSKLDMYLDLGYTVAVMSNYDPPAAQTVSGKFRELLTGKKDRAGAGSAQPRPSPQTASAESNPGPAPVDLK